MNPGFTLSLARQGPLCDWTAQEVHNINHVLIEGRVHYGAGRPSESKIHDVIWMAWSSLWLQNPRSLQNKWLSYWRLSSLWVWMTQDVLQYYGRKTCKWRNLATTLLERARLIYYRSRLPFGSLTTFLVLFKESLETLVDCFHPGLWLS